MTKAYSIKVFGKVQGVGFRYYTQKTARELGVHGFVRNERDGSVYIEAESGKEALETFIEWVKVGPQWARVDDIYIQDIPHQAYVGFDIR